MSKISQRLKRVDEKLDKNEILDFAYGVFRDNTPVASGNAQRKTKKQGEDTIVADYPYAQRLERGYSKQSPDGMTKPTIQAVRKYLRGI